MRDRGGRRGPPGGFSVVLLGFKRFQCATGGVGGAPQAFFAWFCSVLAGFSARQGGVAGVTILIRRGFARF